MGAAASLVEPAAESDLQSTPPPSAAKETAVQEVFIKKLPEAIEESVYVHEKFPLIIDPTGKAKMFLKYQTGSFITQHEFSNQNLINRCLAGCIAHGKTFTAYFETLDDSTTVDFFSPTYFPKEVLTRSQLYQEGVCEKIFRPEDGDDPVPSPQFVFILCTLSETIPPELLRVMHPIKVIDEKREKVVEGGDNELEFIAGLYGAQEIIR